MCVRTQQRLIRSSAFCWRSLGPEKSSLSQQSSGCDLNRLGGCKAFGHAGMCRGVWLCGLRDFPFCAPPQSPSALERQAATASVASAPIDGAAPAVAVDLIPSGSLDVPTRPTPAIAGGSGECLHTDHRQPCATCERTRGVWPFSLRRLIACAWACREEQAAPLITNATTFAFGRLRTPAQVQRPARPQRYCCIHDHWRIRAQERRKNPPIEGASSFFAGSRDGCMYACSHHRWSGMHPPRPLPVPRFVAAR